MYTIKGLNGDIFFNIDEIDYQKPVGDIVVPEDVPGTFNYPEGVEHNRQLRYFVPLNPAYGSLDSNFVFDGWALNNAVGSEAVSLDDLIMPNSALTIYAKWKAPVVNLKFNQVTAPKTEDIDTYENIKATYGTKLGYVPEATDFDRYYFEYWYYYDTDESGNTQKVYYDPAVMTVPAHDIELFPEYSCNEMQSEYSVTAIDNPLGTHASITSSKTNPAFAVEDTIISVDDNVLTVEDTYKLN